MNSVLASHHPALPFCALLGKILKRGFFGILFEDIEGGLPFESVNADTGGPRM